MGPFTSIAIFFTIWWTVLFAVLPWGTVTHAEAGIDKGDGGDPGAPVNPRLKEKFLITTGIAIASEPFGDSGDTWQAVPPGTALTATQDNVSFAEFAVA